jgi:hypothetical protein
VTTNPEEAHAAEHVDEAETVGKNFVAEYFGFRVYPTVDASAGALDTQRRACCPFLTTALRKQTDCVKAESSRGVCVVNTQVDSERFDWLVCPNRALDQGFMQDAAVRLFGYGVDERLHFIAAPTLSLTETTDTIRRAIDADERVLVYFQEKLGGEISIAKSDASPSFAFDWTLVEVLSYNPELKLGRFSILEVQTMDFHGSYAHAILPTAAHLESAPAGFHAWLASSTGQATLSRKMEGPNLSNVFKRTFYQMAYKFQLAGHRDCAGAAFVIPESVWLSWLRHLGNPELLERDDGTYTLAAPHQENEEVAPSWILVFTLSDSDAVGEPGRIRPHVEIQVSAERLIDLALRASPEAALAPGASADGIQDSIRRRIKSLLRTGPTSRK